MPFTFTQSQKDELDTLIVQALSAFDRDRSGSGLFSKVYDALLGMISDEGLVGVAGPTGDVAPNVWAWINGAKDVNTDTGGFAAFIRSYTELQHRARFGTSMETGEMQRASNNVSANFFADLLENLRRDDSADWQLPAIRTIGEADAGAAASVVFHGDYAAWAGTLLFPYLGEPYFFEQLLLASDPFNLPGEPGYNPNTISKHEPGSYDLFSAILIGRLATLENIGSLLLENVTGGPPDIDVAHYEAITNGYFKDFYGLTNAEIDIYNPGGSLIFAQTGAIFPDATYTVGTLHDDSGDGAITLDGEIRSVVNSGTGNDIVGVGFSPANHALLVNLIADGSEGKDTFAYGDEWAFELDVSLFGYSGGYYSSYVNLTNTVSIAGNQIDHRLYGFETVNLSSNDDTFIIEGTLNDALDGLTINGGRHSADGGSDGTIGDTINLRAATSGATVMLAGANQEPGAISLGDHSVSIDNFENVIGTDFDDQIRGGDGSNIIEGGGGADTIDGGGGIDVLDFSNAASIVDMYGYDVGVGLSLTLGVSGDAAGDVYTNVEAVLGSGFDDDFTIDGTRGIYAGGAGFDIFSISASSGSSGPAVVWGGAGPDLYAFDTADAAGILVVNVSNLTEENFQYFDYTRLSVPAGFDWSQIDAIILNPDRNDSISVFDDNLGNSGAYVTVGTGVSTVKATAIEPSDIHEPTLIAELETQTSAFHEFQSTGSVTYAQHVNAYDVSFLTNSNYSVFASAAQVGFFTEVDARLRNDEREEIITTGNGTRTLDVGTAYASVLIEIEDAPFFVDHIREYYAWLHFRYQIDGVWTGGISEGGAPFQFTTDINDIPTFENIEDIGDWFLVGASLDGTSIVANGAFFTSIQVPEGPGGNNRGGDTGSNQSNFIGTFGGVGTTVTYAGFSASKNALLVRGTPIDPNTPPSGITVSQSGGNVHVSGASGVIILEDVDLTAWQTEAQGQILGSQSADEIDGTSVGEVISTGAGNDTIYGYAGDDTIAYVSGNDVIMGNKKNAGHDTLDLSQYNSDDVTFRVKVHDVFVDTPDGTIGLAYQNRYDIGHSRTNIETIVFADGTLGEETIRNRSVNDASSAGDDSVGGSYLNDTIVGSAGDDTIDAWYGNDMITYVSGIDQIIGGQGQDTLDLSQYTSDQVSFHNDGFDVIINTQDGSIELHYQVRYEVGHQATNIETLIFADVTLDDSGIRDRALTDQVTSGDDDIIGTLLHGDVLSTGAGNDIVTGFGGNDVFVFTPGDGDDTIADFENGIDLIRIIGGPNSFDDLKITEVNGDAIVPYSATDTIIFDGIAADLLSQDDFKFV